MSTATAPSAKKPSKPEFDWADPLMIEAELSEEERMVRDMARAYAQDKLGPRVIAAYRDEATDPSIFREMGELGLLGSTIPRNMAGRASTMWAMALSPARWSGSTAATAQCSPYSPRS